MGIPRVIPKVIKGQGGKALPFGTTLSAGLDLVLEDTTQHSISSIYSSATTRPHLLPPPLMLRLLQRKPPPPQLQPHMLVSGIVHVDALSIFYGTLRKLAASHLPSSVSGWLAILAPVLDSFLKSVGNGRIVIFHVDGRLAETGIKQQAHASRTLDVLRAAATAQQLCAKRKHRHRCGALEKKEEQALMRCFTLTQGDKKHIKEAIEAFLDPLSYHAVCWCEHEADVCIARDAAEYASQPSNVLPLAVITGDSDLVFHCAGRCGVLMTRMHSGHATNIRTFNHQGVATIAAALGLRVFPGVCQLFAAIANNDYHSCHGRGNAAAVKFINDQFDAAAKERRFNNPADFCALLHDPMEADAFANRVKNAYVADLLSLDGGVALAKSFLNAFGVFVYHDESGTFANTVTFPTSDSSQSGNVPKKSVAVDATTTHQAKCQLHDGCLVIHPKAQQGKQDPNIIHLTQDDIMPLVRNIVKEQQLSLMLDKVKDCPAALDCVLRHVADRITHITNGVKGCNILAKISRSASVQLLEIVRKQAREAEERAKLGPKDRAIWDGHGAALRMKKQLGKIVNPPCKSHRHLSTPKTDAQKDTQPATQPATQQVKHQGKAITRGSSPLTAAGIRDKAIKRRGALKDLKNCRLVTRHEQLKEVIDLLTSIIKQATEAQLPKLPEQELPSADGQAGQADRKILYLNQDADIRTTARRQITKQQEAANKQKREKQAAKAAADKAIDRNKESARRQDRHTQPVDPKQTRKGGARVTQGRVDRKGGRLTSGAPMTLPAAIGGNNQQAAVHAPGQPAVDTPSQAATDATDQAAADTPDQPGEDASDHCHMRVLLEDMLSGGPQSAPIFGVHAIRSSTSWTRRQLIEDIVARIQSFTVGMRHAGLVVIGAVVEELLELDQDAPLPPSYHVYKWPDGKATRYCFLDADLKDLDDLGDKDVIKGLGAVTKAELLSGQFTLREDIAARTMYGASQYNGSSKHPRFGHRVRLVKGTRLERVMFEKVETRKLPNGQPPAPAAPAVPSPNELLAMLVASESGGQTSAACILRHLSFVLTGEQMVKPMSIMLTLNAWLVTVVQLLIHRSWTPGSMTDQAAPPADTIKADMDTGNAQQAGALRTTVRMAEMKVGARRPAKKQQTRGRHPDMWWSSLHPADAQQADTQQAVVPYRLVNTLCARATKQIFENLAREVSATLAKHFIENRSKLALVAAQRAMPAATSEQIAAWVDAIFKPLKTTKVARHAAAQDAVQDAAQDTAQDAPLPAIEDDAMDDAMDATQDVAPPAPTLKRTASQLLLATDGSTSKRQRDETTAPVATDAMQDTPPATQDGDAIEIPQELNPIQAIVRSMSTSDIGRFYQLLKLAGTSVMKLCPQPASRDPFILVTEATLFWAVVGLQSDRIGNEHDPVLQALRKELLAAVDAKLELGTDDKVIQRAFSNSKELAILDILLPGLRPKNRRRPTQAEGDEAAVDSQPLVASKQVIRQGSIMTDGYTVYQLALDCRTDRPESPRSPNAASPAQQPSLADAAVGILNALNGQFIEPDHMDVTSADPADPSATKPKATNPAQRNFNASQRLPNVADANKLLADKGYETVCVVSFDWGERYLYGASSMLVNVEDKTYTMESNYVLSSGMARAEGIFQRWLNNRYAKAADVHEAIAFKTAKHADPNATAGERAFWDLRCHAYCTPFLNARKVKAKRFTKRSNSTSDRGNALEGIMKLAGSKTGERASRASQGLPVDRTKSTEDNIPVVWAFGIDFTGQGGRHAVFEDFLIRHLRSSGYAYIYRCNENLTSQMCPQCKQRIPDKNRTNLRRYECTDCKTVYHRDVLGATNIGMVALGHLFHGQRPLYLTHTPAGQPVNSIAAVSSTDTASHSM